MNSHSNNEIDSSRRAKSHLSLAAVTQAGSESERQQAIAALCERFWVPVYFFVRQSGNAAERAGDLTHRFLAGIAARLQAGPEPMSEGFRTFVQHSLSAFLENPASVGAAEFSRPLAPPAPPEEIERRFLAGFADPMTPVQAMQRGFALELLARALARLRSEAEHAGRGELFEVVRHWLSREPGEDDYRKLAQQVGSSPLAMVVAVKRLRQRFQELVDEELAQSVGDAAEVPHERQTMLSMVVPDP